MKSWYSPLLAMSMLLAMSATAVAAERALWVGRDTDNTSVYWTCVKGSGDNWTLKKNGTAYLEYEGVTSTSEFVELQAKGTKRFDRLRLYKDRLSLNKKGSKTDWIEIAKGKWRN